MANIGVVDNSAKSALAMQGMVNQARSGNMAQARDYKMYLDKLGSGYGDRRSEERDYAHEPRAHKG